MDLVHAENFYFFLTPPPPKNCCSTYPRGQNFIPKIGVVISRLVEIETFGGRNFSVG